MCFRLLCCGGGDTKAADPEVVELSPEQVKDYDDLVFIAQKREIKITVATGAKAGVIAGLMVMGGVIVAGPVGAAVGGAVGTATAMKMSKNIVTLNELLSNTPSNKRGEVMGIFREAIQEEFTEGFQNNPELKLLLSGGSIFGVMRYALEKDLIESEKLDALDNILKKITL